MILLTCVICACLPAAFAYADDENGQENEGAPEESTAAINDGLPYFEPVKGIIIGEPNEKSLYYTTTAEKISILGACCTSYPLFMNGKEVPFSENGFFSVYVDLKQGENLFTFTNGETKLVYTISKKDPGKTGSEREPEYIAYRKAKSGMVTNTYLMPRMQVSASDTVKMPIEKSTELLLVGEKGNYYRLVDDSFVSKSGVEISERQLPLNKVWGIRLLDDTEKNCITAEIKTGINVLHKAEITGNRVSLYLYGTVSGKAVKVPENDTVERIDFRTGETGNGSAPGNSENDCPPGDVSKQETLPENTLIIDFILNDGMHACGYDVTFEDGKMLFVIKKAPHLYTEDKSRLDGAVVLLDAGHGEDNLGAVGPMGLAGPNEKHFNLDITLKTARILEGMGAHVEVVRSDDTFYSLDYRVNAIRTLKPDISVSIHGNAVDYGLDFWQYKGFLTYYSYDLTDNIPGFMNEGVCERMGFEPEPPQCKSLSLTRVTICPAVLLETKFLSNPDDYEFLLKEKNREAYAQAIASTISEYLRSSAVYR